MESFETQRLLIRELKIDDARRLSEYRNKKEVAFYQSWWHYPYSRAVKRVEYCLKHPFEGKRGTYQLGVVLKSENYLIGDYFLEVIEESSITIGYTFDSTYWHYGYATESLQELLKKLKDTYHFKRVYAHVYDDNERSLHLLKKLGFKQYAHSKLRGEISLMLDLFKE